MRIVYLTPLNTQELTSQLRRKNVVRTRGSQQLHNRQLAAATKVQHLLVKAVDGLSDLREKAPATPDRLTAPFEKVAAPLEKVTGPVRKVSAPPTNRRLHEADKPRLGRTPAAVPGVPVRPECRQGGVAGSGHGARHGHILTFRDGSGPGRKVGPGAGLTECRS